MGLPDFPYSKWLKNITENREPDQDGICFTCKTVKDIYIMNQKFWTMKNVKSDILYFQDTLLT